VSATSTALRKARRGAAFLDAKLGRGWRRKIRRRDLNLASPCNCIIGQLYNCDFEGGLRDLGIRSDRSVERFGFEETPLAQYDDLTEAWLEVLRGRA